MTTLATIYYTADILAPDETDTNVYGEPCEPGFGQSMESGWWNPDYDLWSVREKQSDVTPDVIDSKDARLDDELLTLSELVETVIEERIGSIDSFDDDSAYAADSLDNYQTGVRVLRHAHVTYSGRS